MRRRRRRTRPLVPAFLAVGSSLALIRLLGSGARAFSTIRGFRGSRRAEPAAIAVGKILTRTRTTRTGAAGRRGAANLLRLRLHHRTSPDAGAAAASAHRGSTTVAVVAESEWRREAEEHRSRVRELLEPGLLLPSPQRARRQDCDSEAAAWPPLDPRNPVYNFLIEYYGLRGSKGARRLGLWSPDFASLNGGGPRGEVLLAGATDRDLGAALHRRGAAPMGSPDGASGVAYRPFLYYSEKKEAMLLEDKKGGTATAAARLIGPYLWYSRILERTLEAEPVLYCYGLHEWAMQYRPEGAPPPPSARYQSHLPLRCGQDEINAVVEGGTGAGGQSRLSCTHFDALRFFAPAAVPLNRLPGEASGRISSALTRGDQLRIEQPGCVHAHMDLLKMCLKLVPMGGSSSLLRRALGLALDARRLDVAASPHDASGYGVDPVRVETAGGRDRYRREQLRLAVRAQSLRRDLLAAYRSFLRAAFEPADVEEAEAAFDRTWRADQAQRAG
jgi:hypothetical protein